MGHREIDIEYCPYCHSPMKYDYLKGIYDCRNGCMHGKTRAQVERVRRTLAERKKA